MSIIAPGIPPTAQITTCQKSIAPRFGKKFVNEAINSITTPQIALITSLIQFLNMKNNSAKMATATMTIMIVESIAMILGWFVNTINSVVWLVYEPNYSNAKSVMIFECRVF